MAKFTPTDEQLAIRDFILNEKGSLLVSALAGSAKTTTLKFAAESVTTQTIALAFNKKIKDELQEALPTHFDVMTFNGAGHSAWGRFIGRRLQLNMRKLFEITKPLANNEARPLVTKLVNAARTIGLVPDGTLPAKPQKIFFKDNEEGWLEAIGLAGIDDPNQFLIDEARKYLLSSIELAFAGNIDFNDQIYMPCVFGGMWKTAPLVFVDEAQDLSNLNHYMLRRMALRRVIAVGDENQAIYAFRGSSTRSMEQLAETFSMSQLSLTTCFRCAKSIVRDANRLVPHMRSASWSPEGAVIYPEKWNLDSILPNSAVVCRNNAPLFALGFAFLAANRPVNFLGKDLGWAIEKEIKELSNKKNIYREQLLEAMQLKLARLSEDEDKQGRLFDIMETIEAIPGVTTDEILENLKALLNAPTGDVTLSSIHGSKGLEWPVVYFLDSWRVPSKYAETPEAIQQEHNLDYVAVTRAKRALIYINMKEFAPADYVDNSPIQAATEFEDA